MDDERDDLQLEADGAGRIAADVAHAAAEAGRILLVDIRTPQEWRSTGVPAAAALACLTTGPGDIRAEFIDEIERLAGGDKLRPVALVCRSGARSAFARRLLLARGFAAVFDVAEGMGGSSFGHGWLARGLPVEPWPREPAAGPPVT
ncbi:MAG: rhodanese-like domain-containing protein [Geminicoccaceae bacterium]|nr:rhodanese-like domain-containing protein [Geminicoccaceae bacterium]